MLDTAKRCGISGAVYTQTTDVEHEVNGFFTYDRQVEKMDFDQVRNVNQSIIRNAESSAEGETDSRLGPRGHVVTGSTPTNCG